MVNLWVKCEQHSQHSCIRVLNTKIIITARKRSLRRLCFYRCLSVHRGRAWLGRGACMAGEGGCVAGEGGAWLGRGAYVAREGGMHGLGGGCVAEGMHGWGGGVHGWGGGHAWLGRGDMWLGACMAGEGGYVAGGMHGWGGGCAWLGGMCSWEVCKADTMGTAYGQWAGSTHPTGMHSCIYVLFDDFL